MKPEKDEPLRSGFSTPLRYHDKNVLDMPKWTAADFTVEKNITM